MSDRVRFELCRALHARRGAIGFRRRRTAAFDLVFATALRKVEDSGVAQEVAQNVSRCRSKGLAIRARRFPSAWLHKAALLESKSWLRGELGRRRS